MPKIEAQARPTSQAQEDYLKALYSLGAAHGLVPPSQVARELQVSAASVSEMLGKLAGLDLVVHDRKRGARLTDSGRVAALEMVRHHRLLEAFMVEALGYTWDEVHDEADRLEHFISERLEARIYESLGRPSVDPHGDPIPAADGSMAPAGLRPLTACRQGERVVLRRVSDREPAKLRAIKDLNLRIGESVRVERESEWEGPIDVLAGDRRLQLPLGLARVMFVD